MGRRKLEMKKIENLDARRVCFTKRRQGLFKKAAKLSKDHNLKILSIVFSPAGKPFVFSSGDPSISFDSMLENFLLDGFSSSSHPVVENDFEHCTTSSVVDAATIDLEDISLNVEEEGEALVSSPEGISLNVEEEEGETLVSSSEGISNSSFQFGEIQPLSDFEIENLNLLCTNFESGGFEEQTNLDVEDYPIEEMVLLGAEDNYGFRTDLSQIQFGEEYEFDPILLDSNLYDNDATTTMFEEVFQ